MSKSALLGHGGSCPGGVSLTFPGLGSHSGCGGAETDFRDLLAFLNHLSTASDTPYILFNHRVSQSKYGPKIKYVEGHLLGINQRDLKTRSLSTPLVMPKEETPAPLFWRSHKQQTLLLSQMTKLHD